MKTDANIVKIIPFRLQSDRFPNKPLARVFGRSLVENALAVASRITRVAVVSETLELIGYRAS